jgi:DNA-damage-inducible protein J
MDDETKAQATEALAAIGMSVSVAVRLFLRRVVTDQAFPLELDVPNAETHAAMAEFRSMMAPRRARFIGLCPRRWGPARPPCQVRRSMLCGSGP